MAALDRVIVIYKPGYVPSTRRRGRPAKEGAIPRAEITKLMSGVNKRQTVLEILREARQPLSTPKCAVRFAEKLGLADGDIREPISQIVCQRSSTSSQRSAG